MIGTIDVKVAEALQRKQKDIDLAIDAGRVKAARLFEITAKEQVLDLVGQQHTSFRDSVHTWLSKA